MDTKEIISMFVEYVLAHPAYYLTMTALLVILISLLISMQKPRRDRKERKAQQNGKNYAPIYAAGDEMDRVKKRSYFQQESNHLPFPLVLLVVCLTLTLCSYVKYPEATKNFFHNMLTNTTPTETSRQRNSALYQEMIARAESAQQESQKDAPPIPVGSIKDMEINSTLTFSNDYQQLFVTSVFVNRGNATLYNMVPRYQLVNKDGEVVQQKDGDMIPALGPGESLEKTTAIQLEIEATELSQCLQSLYIK